MHLFGRGDGTGKDAHAFDASTDHVDRPLGGSVRPDRLARLDVEGRPLTLLVDVLAAYRLTRFVTADVLSEPARRAVVRRSNPEGAADDPDLSAQEVVEQLKEPPRLATLVTCRWCAGVWVAAGVTVARVAMPRAWTPIAHGLALSAGAALLARYED